MRNNDKYKKLGEKIGSLVDEKNQAYSNSYNETGQILKLLYPNGIMTENYKDMIVLIRMIDKMKRLATSKEAFKENPYKDLIGLTIRLFLNQNNEKI